MAKQTPPSAQKRFQDQFPDVQFHWNDIYSFSFKVSLETKIRELQYKFFKMKKTDLPQCIFCKNEIEPLEHLVYN